MSQSSMNRREFLQLTAGAAAMLGLTGCAGIKISTFPKARKPRPIAPGAKVRVAQIGFNGKGQSDISLAAEGGAEVVALCDVDWSLDGVKKIGEKFPNAKRYQDFRKMLIEMDDQIDAVIVSTPDHMHFLPAYMAMAMGKHVCVQKPLTQTVWEANELLQMARKHKVCTQMGNQGHAGEGIRRVREWIQGGAIGEVKEVHIWTNRPIWPQGMETWPKAEEPAKEMDWDLYLGRAQERTFSKEIHPFKWRGFRDYGAGALGDMGCHVMDAAFWGLDLHKVYPTSVEAEVVGLTDIAFPKGSVVTYKYPARGAMPPVTLKWFDGSCKPPRPADLEENRTLAIGGQLIFGSKATIYDASDYCDSPRIIPEKKFKEMLPGLPKASIRRPEPLKQPQQEWIQAIVKNDPEWAGSNFEYSVPLTMMVVLGNLAVFTGKKLDWDGKKMECTNYPAANKYLTPVHRAGWSPEETVAKAKTV